MGLGYWARYAHQQKGPHVAGPFGLGEGCGLLAAHPGLAAADRIENLAAASARLAACSNGQVTIAAAVIAVIPNDAFGILVNLGHFVSPLVSLIPYQITGYQHTYYFVEVKSARRLRRLRSIKLSRCFWQ